MRRASHLRLPARRARLMRQRHDPPDDEPSSAARAVGASYPPTTIATFRPLRLYRETQHGDERDIISYLDRHAAFFRNSLPFKLA